MSAGFLACTGQPRSQRPRFWQPSCGTPENGCSRASPKWTAIGRRAASRAAGRAARGGGGARGARGGEGGDLAQRRVGGRGARLQRLLGEVVPGVELGAGDRGGPIGL